MKKLKVYAKNCVVVLLNVLLVFCLSCDSSNKDKDDDKGSRGITLKGNFNGTEHASGMLDRIFSFLVPSAYALEPSEVGKVICVDLDNSGGPENYLNGDKVRVADVSGGSFSIKIPSDKPSGIIFAGHDDSFKGYLILEEGINSIPGFLIKEDEVSEIDLETLMSSGEVVLPGHNPIGDEIVIDDEVKDIVAFSDHFGFIILKYADFDNNGIVDLLENKVVRTGTQLWIYHGIFEDGDVTPTIRAEPVIDVYQPGIELTNFDLPENVTYTGPATGLPLVYSFWPAPEISENTETIVFLTGDNCLPPYTSGEYSFELNGSPITFELAPRDEVIDGLIYIVPHAVLNADGTVERITFTYQTSDGTIISNPEKLYPGYTICGIEVQWENTESVVQYYSVDSYRLLPGNDMVISELEDSCWQGQLPPEREILWSGVFRVTTGNYDNYGNTVTFYYQTPIDPTLI